jgi:hypothetical protein
MAAGLGDAQGPILVTLARTAATIGPEVLYLMPIDLRFDPDEVALMTDLYELTMAASYFALGYNELACLDFW